MKWTDQQIAPANRRPNLNLRALIEELCREPGRWAEVGRYPAERKQSARTRGSQTVTRYPILEYAVEADGDEYVLYFRVPQVSA